LAETPYKFLDQYNSEDSDIFFGREKEIRILQSDIVISRLVVLFARTGTGKTSLIDAGVRPRLNKRGYKTLLIRVHRNPSDSAQKGFDQNRQILGPLPEALRAQPLEVKLAEQLKYLADHSDRSIVLFFDQFEEFFIYYFRDHPEQARRFISDLAKTIQDPDLGVHIVLSMREEFFHELNLFRDYIPTIFHNESNLRLRWFNEVQAREAIVKPAGEFDTIIEEEAVDQIISDLKDPKEEEMIEPAQLQIVCDTLWRHRKDGRITLKDYRELGRDRGETPIAQQVLYQRLEEVFENIHTENGEELLLLETLLPLLKTQKNTKNLWEFQLLLEALKNDSSLGPLAGNLETKLRDLLRTMEQSRMIRTIERGDQMLIELAHDYLVEGLDTIAERVRGIWPRKVCRQAWDRYRQSNQLATPYELDIISTVPDKLRATTDQIEFLFRSSLEAGNDMLLWFDQANKAGIDVWKIIEKRIQNTDPTPAYKVARLLGQLASDKALQELEHLLKRNELALSAIEALADVPRPEVVDLLAKNLNHPRWRERTLEELESLTRSNNAEVAARASDILLNKLEVRREIKSLKAASQEDREVATRDVISPEIMDGLSKGRVVPFLGMDLWPDHPTYEPWQAGISTSPPSVAQLSQLLIQLSDFPAENDRSDIDLAQVASFFAAKVGRSRLRQCLRDIYGRDYAIPALHTHLAAMPAPLLLVTTNYDDLIERAFHKLGRPFHLVVNPTDRDDLIGSVLWWPPNAREPQAVSPNRLYIDDLESTTVIYKMYGSVNRQSADYDSYVITEDDHVDFLYRMTGQMAVPAQFFRHFRIHPFLFIGFGLNDWMFRALLRSLNLGSERSWAIHAHQSELEKQLWSTQQIKIYEIEISDFVTRLNKENN